MPPKAATQYDDNKGFKLQEFDGDIETYKTFRGKVELRAARKRAVGTEYVVGPDLMQVPTGRAWGAVVLGRRFWRFSTSVASMTLAQKCRRPSGISFFRIVRGRREPLVDYLNRLAAA